MRQQSAATPVDEIKCFGRNYVDFGGKVLLELLNKYREPLDTDEFKGTSHFMQLQANTITQLRRRRCAKLFYAIQSTKEGAIYFRLYPRDGAAIQFERNINSHSF